MHRLLIIPMLYFLVLMLVLEWNTFEILVINDFCQSGAKKLFNQLQEE